MCGIIGFTGNLQAPGILVDGLQQLEYRGYDSAGIAVNNGSETQIVKTTGKVATLREKVAATAGLEGTCGIGHTRWATHGGVTEVNAHPHVSGNVTLIHNGIIENYKELAASLKTKGYTAISETDTEVAAMLIDSLYDGDPFVALKEADKVLEGAYGFCVMFKDHPGEIYCMRNASPLVASHTEDGSFIASDMVALLKYTKDYFVVPEEHIVVMKGDSITLYTMDGEVEEPKMLHVDWDTTAAQKGGYDFFISLGNNEIRAKLFDQIVRFNGKLVNLIQPSSVIADDFLLGKGVAIMANVVINSKTEINDGCIINTLSSVDHENKIGKFVHISPGCHLSGKVQIGAKCWLGTGCNVVNNILICEESIIGAGSVIIKDIVESGTYVGVPSKRVKR